MGLTASSRLYYNDSYLTVFSARIQEKSPDERCLWLDQTAFYPTSGGQPHDTGYINGIAVTDVIDEGERIAHVTAAPVPGDEAQCLIDWARRFDHMQQHTGQHLLSAVLADLHKARTVSFHLGAEVSTIDVDVPALDYQQVAEAEARANELVFRNLPVQVSYENSSEAAGLRKASDRTGVLRIVSISGLDRSACGGTHVRATGEVGSILIRKLDKAHGHVRIELLCGARAVRRVRSDWDALSRISRTMGSPPDDTPRLVAELSKSLEASEKAKRRLSIDLAGFRGRELYESTPENAAGLRCAVRAGAEFSDELRAFAQSFASHSKAVFLAVSENPAALLLAASKDADIHAGEVLKGVLAKAGGRGGGNAQIAQGSAPSLQALKEARRELCSRLGL